MTQRTISVYFSKTVIGPQGETLSAHLAQLIALHGTNLPVAVVEGDRFQMRGLELVGTVWKGTFAKLREDTPHVIDQEDQEGELQLAEGSSIIEKCLFLYRQTHNVLVWQVSMTAGGLSRAAAYLSQTLGQPVLLPQIQNTAQLEELLNADIYEIDFQYAQPPNLPPGASMWSQRAFDILGSTGASYARFTMRAKRGSHLSQDVKEGVAEMVGAKKFRRVRVKLNASDDPIKLFLAPLKEQFTIEVIGRYPRSDLVFQGLEDAYGRQQDNILGNAA
ncbi:DUF6731 family protein [Pseudacidovorax intermedius]|uniref:DUF6731 family protein n=1 Tax=Pseudacidovorax intermedius TaxID=433924 RepID=UPI0026F30A4F|nr:DUF6731 family protein [Pseudacidovorax intermedius]